VMGLLMTINATDDAALEMGHTALVVSSVRGDPVDSARTQQ
jgi:hypothetical protein